MELNAARFAADAAGWLIDPGELTVSRISRGERHHVFRVTAPSGFQPSSVVVRVNAIASDTERKKTRREAEVLRVIGGSIAPRLLTVEMRGLWPEPATCLEWIDGDHEDPSGLPLQRLRDLGIVVATLHERDPADFRRAIPVQLDKWSLAANLATRLPYEIDRRLSMIGEALPSQLRAGIEAAERAVKRGVETAQKRGLLDSAEWPSLLHSDLGGDNILWPAGRPVLIDWEDARLGDPAEDVAYTITENRLDAERRDAFLTSYRDQRNTTGTFLPRVEMWERITALGSALWWVDRAARKVRVGAPDDGSAPRSAGYYIAHAERRLEWFDAT
jgi:aminoglycoside phosphotransferase (APT) family kinase protein